MHGSPKDACDWRCVSLPEPHQLCADESIRPEYVQRTCIGEPHEGTDPLMLGRRTFSWTWHRWSTQWSDAREEGPIPYRFDRSTATGVTRNGPLSLPAMRAVYVVCECCLHMVPHGVLPKQHVMQGHVCAHHTHTHQFALFTEPMVAGIWHEHTMWCKRASPAHQLPLICTSVIFPNVSPTVHCAFLSSILQTSPDTASVDSF